MTRTIFWTLVALASTASAQTPAREAETPKQLAVGKEGTFRPGALLQVWYSYDRVDADSDNSFFRIRRAELAVRGQIVPDRIAYKVMFDPAKVLETKKVEIPDDPATPEDESATINSPAGKVSVLQDVEVTLLTDWADVSAGQFKIPVSWEGHGSASKLLFPERSEVARAYGDKRDIGIKAEKKFERFGYVFGLFNGTELNNEEVDDAKDLGLRLEAYPIDGLVLAGVLYATLIERDEAKEDRYEADVRFERGPLLLQSEYIRANDNGTKAHGLYAALGWTFADKIQPIVRVGFLDPDVDVNLDPGTDRKERDELTTFEAGVNYLIRKHEAKLQLAASRFAYDDKDAKTIVIAAAQVSF
jgi:phosphate-selective porin